ncbi:MAG: polyprenyl synthetase family protein [Myxococcota bacterium]
MPNPPASDTRAPRDATAKRRSIESAFGRIAGPLGLVERAMRAQLDSEAAVVNALGDHVFSSGGKRLRPALVLLVAELCGYTGPRRIQIAAAIELLHTATLMHDDVVDVADLRRGRPSANAIWGNRRAILGGDFLYACASSMVVDDGDVDILSAFARAIQMVSEGELLQLQDSFDATITEAQYYRVIERKSASLLAASCEVGSILGGVTRAERRRLFEFGRELGTAFQLRDDALDYDSSAGVMGKQAHADLREGKVTMPLLLALKRCTAGEHESVARVLKQAAQRSVSDEEGDDPLDFLPVVELIERYRGVPDTIERAELHTQRACVEVAAFPDGPASQALVDLAHFAVDRDR